MNRCEGNAAFVSAATATLPHDTSITSPAGEPHFKLEAEPTLDAVRPPPIRITEKEVLFSTAAAAPARPRKMPAAPGALYRPRGHALDVP